MTQLVFPSPVDRQEDFYGRKAELKRVVQGLSSSGRLPVIVLGERGIGKTSILNLAALQLSLPEAGGYLPVRVDTNGIKTFAALAGSLLNRMEAVCRRHTAAVPANAECLTGPISSLAEIENQLACIIAACPGQTFLLCIDEADMPVQAAPPRDAALMSALYHYLANTADLPVRLLLSMSTTPGAPGPVQGTSFTSLADLVPLNFFTPAELGEMVTGLLGGGTDVQEQIIPWLYRQSGGHPYLAKLLLAHLPPSGLPDESALEQAVLQALRDPSADLALENLYKMHFNDMERSLLLRLALRHADAPLRIPAGEAPVLSTARGLVSRGYLVESGEGFAHSNRFIARWLRGWPEFDEEIDRLGIGRRDRG